MKVQEQIRLKVPVRKGDQVRVMTGRDRGKTGRVLTVDPVRGYLTVEHANMIKRHTRPNPAKNIKGGIVEREGSIHISNVLLVCPGCHKATRSRHGHTPDGTKIRLCHRCGASLEK